MNVTVPLCVQNHSQKDKTRNKKILYREFKTEYNGTSLFYFH